jgi:hypothetical protein
MVTWRIFGVRTLKSLGEYEYLVGDRSFGDRTSFRTSTRTSMQKSRTSMTMSRTLMRITSSKALEDDRSNNTSSFYFPIISLELKHALSSFEQSFVVSDVCKL